MAKAKKARQLSFAMKDRAGLLSEVTSLLAGAKVNLTSICAYAMEGKAYFMLTADSNAKAKKALAPMRVELCEDDVVSLEMSNKVGELDKAAKKIADAGINIVYMYATAGTGRASTCVFETADNKKAIRVLNR
jgi:hypothetical protein